MGCAESKDGDGEAQSNRNRPKYRSCTDVFWLAVYVLFWLFLVSVFININIYSVSMYFAHMNAGNNK